MKRKSGAWLGAWMLLLALLTLAKADQPHQLSFRVQKGDTLTNLFGSDWQKAYERNKLVVFRAGQPVTSPDLLIEGMIVRVSSDIGLSPRAVARCGELRVRREQIGATLAALEPKVADNAGAQAVLADVRRLLNDDLRFAADVDFADRQIEYLEALSRQDVVTASSIAPVPTGLSKWWPFLAAALAAALTLCSFIYVRNRTRPRYPEADARYRETVADVNASLKRAG